MVVLTSSWFRRDASVSPSPTAKISMKEAVQSLTPKNLDPEERHRFSQLLLEHGERHLQDWAVVASSQSIRGASPSLAPSIQKKTQWAQSPSFSSSSTLRRTKGGRPLSAKRPNIHIYEKAFAPSVNMGKIEGRLHLCSRSIVFEPSDTTRGVVRCPFHRMEAPPRPSSPDKNSTQFKKFVIEFPCSRHLVIKANNTIGPFDSVEVPVLFRFSFLHSTPDRFVELCQELYRLVKHNPRKGFATPELDRIMKPMLDRPFDPTNLVDIRERPLTTNLRCSLLSPLQSKPGCVLVTSDRLYFQQAEGVLPDVAVAKATSWWLADIVAKARRYKGLKDSALELYWKDGSSVLLGFERPRDRERVLRLLPKHTPCHTDRDFIVEAGREWRNGNISNYDYLMVLNSAAGRSFHDLSRYPVFPWVIADYESDSLDLTKETTFRDLSKPIGALNEERLEYFRTRLQGMQDMQEPFLYGTHYSAPGYVLYFLVRQMPEQMLCLQNGKFDAPDRMFHSVAHCYSCVLTNHADVKELIPEFYNPSGGFDFLINARGLQLGATQTGDRVHDVKLPPWAKSPRDFLRKNRKALESEICTRKLPEWIDLIFGVSSRGDKAMEASNLFHPMAYLCAKDVESMESDEERFQAELQAVEFGIVPDQLFGEPHPLRGDHVESDNFILKDLGRTVIDAEGEGSISAESARSGEQAWELLEPPSSSTIDEARVIARTGSTDSANSRKRDGRPSSSSVGYGTTSVVRAGEVPSFRKEHMSTTIDEHSSSQDHEALATPGGKAKSSWTSSASLPAAAESSSHGTDATVSINRHLGQVQSSEERYGYVGSTHADESEPRMPSRALPLRGSGDAARTAKRGLEQDRQRRRSENEVSPAASSDQKSDASITLSQAQSGWDLKLLEKKNLSSDSVSGCSLLLEVGPQKKSYLTTVSLDGSLRVHSISLEEPEKESTDVSRRGFAGTFSRFPYLGVNQPSIAHSKLSSYRSHAAKDPLACLALTADGHGGQVVFAGGHDDVVLAYGINSACAVASVYCHRDAVTGIDIISRSPNHVLENAIWPEKSTHVMVSGSWDATVKVFSVAVAAGETVSINREPLAEFFDADASVVSMSATSLSNGVAISAGCTDGSFVVWLFHDDGTKVMIHKEPARRGAGPCSSVKWTEDNGETYLFTCFANGKIASFTLSNGTLETISAVSIGVAAKCLEYSEGILFAGCADGGLRLIPIRDGAYFDARPTLWPALHGKSASSITCISVSFTREKCICLTGAEDGSVVLFELRKVC